jgi:hypothetical protein
MAWDFTFDGDPWVTRGIPNRSQFFSEHLRSRCTNHFAKSLSGLVYEGLCARMVRFNGRVRDLMIMLLCAEEAPAECRLHPRERRAHELCIIIFIYSALWALIAIAPWPIPCSLISNSQTSFHRTGGLVKHPKKHAPQFCGGERHTGQILDKCSCMNNLDKSLVLRNYERLVEPTAGPLG